MTVNATPAQRRPARRAPARERRIPPGYILPSAAYTIARRQVAAYLPIDRPPQVGDLVYGSVRYIGQHSSLENKEGRIHLIHDGTRAVFVFGNRYAPDYYEGVVPEEPGSTVDLLARSGLVGTVRCKSASVKDPTRVRLLGYVADPHGSVLNTRDYPLIEPKTRVKKARRARMVLVVGTAMNSGKTLAAVACCWALRAMGHRVRAAKVTGTASLKDILHMEDAGAGPVADFTYLGFPSTYLLPEADLLRAFNTLDLRYANNPRNYWVVELADGILQRETAMLLAAEDVTSRIHRLIFTAGDAFGAIGGLRVLRERFGLVPDAISGLCSASPLGVRELGEFTDIPVFNNVQLDLRQLSDILV
ncbi:MAG: hypothetical protein ACODAJ_12550 [Planctomycetota bacterium]